MPHEIPDQFTYRDLDTRLPLIDVATFWATVARSGDCWLWQGATNRDGYGLARLAAIHDRLAHRIAYRPELHIAKHRHGPIGVVPYRFDAATTRFDDLTYRDIVLRI